MKQKLATIGISFVTTIATLSISLWLVSKYPIPLGIKHLKDGSILHQKFYVFQGLYEGDFTDKSGRLLRHLSFYHFDPDQTCRWAYYNENGALTRIEILTVPGSGVNVRKIYRPAYNKPICESVTIYPSSDGPQREFFDESGNAISEDKFKQIVAQN